MKRLTSYLPFAAILLLLVLALPALAQSDNLVNVHFYNAVALPGRILPAGNYVFRFTNPDSAARYVEVETQNGTALGFFAMYPTYADRAPSQLVINTSKPDHAGVVRFKSLFFPGHSLGYHFIYTKGDRRKLDRIAQKMQPKTAAGM